MRERRLRSQVRKYQACLGSLNDLDRHYLTLRAGLDGAPQSQGQAARRLGISRSDARVIERHGMRQLRFACGGGKSSGSGKDISARAPHMLQLQDASLLIATGGAAPAQLVDQRQLSGAQHGVKGVHASSKASEGSSKLASSVSHALAAASEKLSAIWFVIVAALALATAVALVTVRRRSVPDGPPQLPRMTVARTLPPPPPLPPVLARPEAEAEREPPPVPALQRAPEPPRFEVAQPQQTPGQARDYRRAAMIASGLVSVAARELMRRRRGRR